MFFLQGDAQVRFERVHKQADATSSGSWAIAFAFDLALDRDLRDTTCDGPKVL